MWKNTRTIKHIIFGNIITFNISGIVMSPPAPWNTNALGGVATKKHQKL